MGDEAERRWIQYDSFIENIFVAICDPLSAEYSFMNICVGCLRLSCMKIVVDKSLHEYFRLLDIHYSIIADIFCNHPLE